MLLMYNYVLLKMSTWYSKHVEESNNIWRINNIQCITLVVLYGQVYSGMKLYMFRTVPLSIIRSLFTVHSAIVYVIQVCRQLVCRQLSSSCSKAVYKPVWHIQLLSVQWIKSWWWTEELYETCRVSCQNKFVKLVHLVGFITKRKYVFWRYAVSVKSVSEISQDQRSEVCKCKQIGVRQG